MSRAASRVPFRGRSRVVGAAAPAGSIENAKGKAYGGAVSTGRPSRRRVTAKSPGGIARRRAEPPAF
jgi:hypothetical protein